MLSSPDSRSKIWEPLDLKFGKAGENRGQIVADGDADTATGLDDAEDGSDLRRRRASRVFLEVVAQFEFRVFQEACEFRPSASA
jgi:hypothetical protein